MAQRASSQYEQPPQRVYVDISWRALFKVLAIFIGIYGIIVLRDILVMLVAVFIFVAAANPTVSKFQEHMSRPLAVALFFTLVVAGVSLISYLLIPAFIEQLNALVSAAPGLADKAQHVLQGLQQSDRYAQVIDQAVGSLSRVAQTVSGNLLQTTYGVVGSLATALTGIVLAFYFLLEEKNARDFFHQILPHNRYEAMYETVHKISDRMGSWVRGQLLLMFIIGVFNLIVYLILGVQSPLPLAVWAGLCELIPIIGPLIGVIPALAVTLIEGDVVKAALVFIFGLVLIQQLEAHVIVPRVMSRAVGLSPVLVIIALLIGAKLFGILGALMAVPIAAAVSVVVGEWPSLRRLWETH